MLSSSRRELTLLVNIRQVLNDFITQLFLLFFLIQKDILAHITEKMNCAVKIKKYVLILQYQPRINIPYATHAHSQVS